MQIEQKKISSTENLLFFTQPLMMIGTFYASDYVSSKHQILKNLQATKLISELLLTADFIYIKASHPENLEDLTFLALAEIEEYIAQNSPIETGETENIESKIRILLKMIIAPFLQRDGGDIEFISYENGIVSVHFLGKCQGCAYAKQTLQNHVAKNLLRYLPQIQEVTLK